MKSRVAAVYLRISQDRSSSELGVERQLEECRSLAEREGLEIPDDLIFRDNDVSAYSGVRRPAYGAMLSRLGEVDAILTWTFDRLHRSLRDHVDLVDACRKHGVLAVSAKGERIDPNDSAATLTAGFLANIADFESRRRGERVRAKVRQTISQGRHPGGRRPFGWNVTERTDEERAAKLGALYEVNEEEASALREAAEDVLQRGRTLGAICRQWNEDGKVTTVPHANGTVTPWAPTTLRKVLVRPRNAGLLYVRDRETGDDELVARRPELAVFSQATHDSLVRHFRRRLRPAHTGKALYLLAGIIRCHCGTTAKTSVLSGRGVSRGLGTDAPPRVYKCPSKGSGHTAKRVDFADAVALWAVRDWFTHAYEYRDELSPEDEARISELEADLQEIDRERESVLYQAGSSGQPLTTLQPFLDGLEDRRLDIEQEQEALLQRRRTVAQPRTEMGRDLEGLKVAKAEYDDFLALPLDDQRDFIRAHFDLVMHPHDPTLPRKFDPHSVEVLTRRGMSRVTEYTGTFGPLEVGQRVGPWWPELTDPEDLQERHDDFIENVHHLIPELNAPLP